MTDNEMIIEVLRMIKDVDDECDKHGDCKGCKYYDSTICALKMAICTHISPPIDKCKSLLEELEELENMKDEC